MLARMLLHVAEATWPVNEAVYFCRVQRRSQTMRDALPFVDHADNGDAVYGSQVVRLPA